ncbi:MAG TPA: fumarylacetoacetate hydrolase family protein [Acidobacteriota bacterium]|nr:fumarylacetoacetate hydrolase family protein [Acidobacteriota bacterium]
MKYCSFSCEGRERFGFELSAGWIVDLVEAGSHLVNSGTLSEPARSLLQASDLRCWLSWGSEGLEVAETIRDALLGENRDTACGVYSRRKVRLLAPIKRPGKIIGVGLNYADHAEEQNVPLPEKPRIFAKFPTAVVGPDVPIKLPPSSEKVDPEAELCVVILKRCYRVNKSQAREAAAFMIGNDVSARDLQYSDKQWVRGKSCDTFAPCGPFIVTLDEVGDPHELDIELRVNDEVQQSSNTRQLIFDCYELIEFISQTSTLEPGDIIFTGTPSGVGVFRDPPVFLEPGDVVEVIIEKLGHLRNPVVANA